MAARQRSAITHIFFENLLQDLRLARRALFHNPGFSLTVVLVVAIGLGATTAVFSVVDRLLFRDLPYPQADRIVSIGITIPWMEGEFLFSNDYFHLREQQAGLFSALTSWTGIADCDLSEHNPQRLACAQVEWNFLPALGVAPSLGRNFHSGEDRVNAPQVALLSDGLWRSRFGGNPGVLGQTVHVNGLPTRVIGILPASFELPNLAHADLLIPQDLSAAQYVPQSQGGGRAIRVFGRLERGVTRAQALGMAAPYLLDPALKVPGLRTVIRSLRDYQIGDVKLAAWLLFGSTLSILLIVCANVANLLLARAAGRQREFALRAALGAQWLRLLQQNFAESLLLAGAGALLGVACARILLQVFKHLAPVGIPRIQQASLDSRVLLALIGLSFFLAAAFALFTAFYHPEPELLSSGNRVAGQSKNFFRQVLTVAQVAVSLVLLTIAGLLMKSLSNLQGVAPGIAVDHVTTAEIAVGPPRYPTAASRQQFFEELSARLRNLPGVKAVALSDTAPPIGFIHTRPARTLQVVGQRSDKPLPAGIVAWRSVSPGYFAALGIPIREGRNFTQKDRIGQDNPIIINQTWALHLFGKENPVGRVIRLGSDSLLTIIGVAADVRNNGLSQPTDPEYYIVRKQVSDPNLGRDEVLASRSVHWYDGEAFLIVRSSAGPATVARWIRGTLTALDPTVPAAISSMQTRLATLSERPRFTTMLIGFFALVGLALAASGLYGLVSFLVTQRMQELGIRMAVGATRVQIVRLMLSQVLYWSLSGVSIGCAITVLVVRSLRTLVFQVPVENPLLFALAACLLIAVALAAALLPSLRAAQIDPVSTLRRE